MAINTTKSIKAPHSMFKIWKKFRTTKSKTAVVKRKEFFTLFEKILFFNSSLLRKMAIPANIIEKSESTATIARKRKTEIFNQLYPLIGSRGRKF